MARLVVVFALFVASAAAHGSQPEDLRVLFIGNSLTSVNDVPRLVEGLTARGGVRVRAAMVARNNFSLDDHLQDGEATKAIDRGGWSFVVLQQGPSALEESRVSLRAAAKRFDSLIRRAGARPALYMVWPASARRGDFDRVRESYALAASDIGGLFLPAGDAWRAAWRRDTSIELYGNDGFHPTPQASYLSALVIASALTGRDPGSMAARPPGWPVDWLTTERARLLQEAAAQALKR